MNLGLIHKTATKRSPTSASAVASIATPAARSSRRPRGHPRPGDRPGHPAADRRPADPGPDIGFLRDRAPAHVEERDQGLAVLIISSELDKILAPVRPDRGHVRGEDAAGSGPGHPRGGTRRADRQRDRRRRGRVPPRRGLGAAGTETASWARPARHRRPGYGPPRSRPADPARADPAPPRRRRRAGPADDGGRPDQRPASPTPAAAEPPPTRPARARAAEDRSATP